MIDKNELLSDLLDDQCSTEELSQLLNDKDTTNSWYRYSAVSAILKNECSAHVNIEFSQRISALIADEPAIIATKSSRAVNTSAVNNTNVVQFKKTFGGFAVAASVAVATFFSVQTLQVSELSVNETKLIASSNSDTSKDNNNQSVEAISNINSPKQYNDLFQFNAIGSEVPVGAEYVRTIRFSAEQWQEILKKASEQKAIQTQEVKAVNKESKG
jgi:negative regulator of sigma E activity